MAAWVTAAVTQRTAIAVCRHKVFDNKENEGQKGNEEGGSEGGRMRLEEVEYLSEERIRFRLRGKWSEKSP